MGVGSGEGQLRYAMINIYFKMLWTNTEIKMVFLQKNEKNKVGVVSGEGGLAPSPGIFGKQFL